MRTKPSRALLLACLAFVLVPGGAHAAGTTQTINFDDRLGKITDQYNHDADPNRDVNFYSAVFSAADPGPHSAPNLAEMPIPNKLGSIPDLVNAGQGFDFNNCGFAIEFQRTHSDVSVYVGRSQGAASSVFMRAYDAGGHLVAQNSILAVPSGPVSHLLSVHRTADDISSVEVEGQNGYWSADDLSFDVPAVPPPPDIGLSWPGSVPGGVTLGRTESRDLDLDVARVNGSTGPVTLSATSLPSGVGATFTPSTVTGSAAHTPVRMHIQAGNDYIPPVVNQSVVIRATPSATAGSSVRSIRVSVTVLREFDLRARGLDITQGTQLGGPGQGLPQVPISGSVNSYRGVGLVADGFKPTLVRFYADARGSLAGSSPANATLEGYRHGRLLPGSPLHPDAGTGMLTDLGYFSNVTYQERLNGKQPFNFTIPPNWQAGDLTLRARVFDPGSFGGKQTARECRGCLLNNTTELRDILFAKGREITVDPVRVVYTDRTQASKPFIAPPSWSAPFVIANQLMPIRVVPYPWAGDVDVTTHRVFKGFKGWVTRSFIADNGYARNKKAAEIVDDIRDFADDHGLVFPIGILGWFNTYGNPNQSDVGLTVSRPYPDDDLGLVVNDQRPFTSVAHEIGHAFNRLHASGGCGGAANGERANPWPDSYGYINSVGVDFANPGSDGSPHKIIGGGRTNTCTGSSYSAPGCGPTAAPQPFDYMSYCADEKNAWISGSGWIQILSRYNGGGSAARATRRPTATAARRRAGVRVRGFVDASGAHISSAESGMVPDTEGPADSSVSLVAMNAAGKPIGTVKMATSADHVDGPTPAPILSFTGTVPAPSAHAVKVMLDGKAVATRTRSRHAPVARFLGPRKGTTIGRKASVLVKWRASDRDKDVLSVALDYSRNGGASWEQIYAGPNRSAGVRLPSLYFAHARRARLRLRVNDSFNQTTVRSSVFRARGTRPEVRILTPARGTVKAQDATLVLSGYAWDDTRHPLRTKRLRWYVGKTLIGHGETVSAAGLAAGRHRVRLLARDGSGRVGSRSVFVRLFAVQPAFGRLTAPKTLSRKATSVTLVVGASVEAGLRVGAQRFTVSRRARKVRVRVRPGRSTLTLVLRIASGKYSATRTVTIARR